MAKRLVGGRLNKNQLGLSVGVFVALLHVAWAILVAVGFAKGFLDWLLPLHFVGAMFSIITFTFMNAILLIILAFVGGYIIGWLFAAIWNWVSKK